MNEEKIISIRITDIAKGVQEIADLQTRINVLTAEMKKNNRVNAEQKKEYAAMSVAVKDYRSQLNVLIKETNNEVKVGTKKLGHIQQLRAEVSNLTLQYERLSSTELKTARGKEVLTALKDKRAELSQLNEAYGNYSLGVGQYGRATNNLSIQLGMVMKEMPNFAISARTGIMSLTNNLPMLAEALRGVKMQQAEMVAQGKATTSMFKLITKSIFGVTGIVSIAMVLLQLFNKEIIAWFGNLFKGKEALDQASLAQKNFNDTLKDGNATIKNAITDVQTVETAFRQYKERLIDADEALAIFNENLGDNLGAHQDIETAMRAFNDLAPKYIEWSLKMAIAEKAKETAADLALKRIEAEMQKDEKYLKWYEKFRLTWGATQEQINAWHTINEWSADKRRKAAVSGAKEEEDAYTELYKTLTDEASKFAEQWGLDTGKGGTPTETDYKNTPEWKAFSDSYDERRRLMQMELDIEKIQREASADLQKSFDETKTEKAEKEALKRQQIIIKTAKATQQALKRVLDEELRDADESVRAQIQLYNKKLMAELSNADTALATAEAKGSATLQLQMDLLAEQERVDVFAARQRGENVQLIEEYYAAKRVELQQKVAEANLNSIASLFGSMASMLKENTVGQKVAASAQALINTYLGATSAFAQTPGGIITKTIAATAAVAAGMASIKKIWDVKEDVPENSAARNAKTTVTEQFHTGTYRPAEKSEEQEITRTLLTTERILSPTQTSIFDNILGRMQSIGGANTVTRGIGVSGGLEEGMLERSFSRALSNMPAPVVGWKEFTTQRMRQEQLDKNTIIR